MIEIDENSKDQVLTSHDDIDFETIESLTKECFAKKYEFHKLDSFKLPSVITDWFIQVPTSLKKPQNYLEDDDDDDTEDYFDVFQPKQDDNSLNDEPTLISVNVDGIPAKSNYTHETLWIYRNELFNSKRQLREFTDSPDLRKLWRNHTSKLNPSSEVIVELKTNYNPELLTQAWCKMIECLNFCRLSMDEDNFKSGHLCEAPGAFITALNHYLKTNYPHIEWNWLASTLNPYYEGNKDGQMINDCRLIYDTYNQWLFGNDFTGNILNYKNRLSLIKTMGKVDLVTADGSINCLHDPGNQEMIVSSLLLSEIAVALNILKEKANLIVKMFTCFEHSSVCLLYLLVCSFEKVTMFKPATSKEGNSETYLVCVEYKNNLSAEVLSRLTYNATNYGAHLFSKKSIPLEFIEQVIEASGFFKKLQCKAIEKNIQSFRLKKHPILSSLELKTLKESVKNYYISHYCIKKLPMESMKVNQGQPWRLPLSIQKYKYTYEPKDLKAISKEYYKTTLEQFEKDVNAIPVLMRSWINKWSDFSKDDFKFTVLGPMRNPGKKLKTYCRPIKKIRNSQFCHTSLLNLYYQLLEFAIKYQMFKIEEKREKEEKLSTTVIQETLDHPIEECIDEGDAFIVKEKRRKIYLKNDAIFRIYKSWLRECETIVPIDDCSINLPNSEWIFNELKLNFPEEFSLGIPVMTAMDYIKHLRVNYDKMEMRLNQMIYLMENKLKNSKNLAVLNPVCLTQLDANLIRVLSLYFKKTILTNVIDGKSWLIFLDFNQSYDPHLNNLKSIKNGLKLSSKKNYFHSMYDVKACLNYTFLNAFLPHNFILLKGEMLTIIQRLKSI